MADIKQRVAMKAVIINDEGKVLLLRESDNYEDGTNTDKYDMPGGRIEPGENFEVALKREVKEETGMEIVLQHPLHVDEWRPVIKGVQNQIVGMFIVCKPVSSNKVTLGSDHEDYEWINPKDYAQYNLLSAVTNALQAYCKQN